VTLCLCVFFSGCVHQEYNLATGQEETLFYSEDKESRIGRRVAEKIEEEYPVVGDVDANERADNVLEKIIAVCDRKNLIYRISILDRKDSEDDEIINAVSLPGGYVYIFKDLMDKIGTDDQLARSSAMKSRTSRPNTASSACRMSPAPSCCRCWPPHKPARGQPPVWIWR